MSGVSGENDATTSYSASSSGRIAYGAAIVITERLAELPDLALPSSLYKDTACAPATADILAYLQALLQKDPAAFLARYGGVLQSQELNHFEALRSADFEVDHWLGYFAAQRMAAVDQAANPRRLPARVKNRRLAAMRRLAAQGEYFSDEAMRHRAPLLYHQQIGCFIEQQQLHQQQAVAAAVVTGAAAAQKQQDERQGHGRALGCDGAPAAASAGPTSGGIGGSCLAVALQQALRTRDDTLPVASAAAAQAESDPGCAATVLPTTAARHGCESRSEERPPPAETPQPTGRSCAAVGPPSCDSGDYGTDMAMELEGAPGPSARAAAGAVIGGSGGGGSGRPTGRSDLLFSEFLMRQDDEAQLVMRRRQEQQDEDAQMSEHDSDDDEEDEDEDEEPESDGGKQGDDKGGRQGARAPPASRGRSRRGRPSASERAQMRRDFMLEMQSRFLLGQDGQYVDYGAIDADASLDGDWLEQESRDAEEKYFDED